MAKYPSNPAIHEAGHIIAALELGWPISSAWIDGDKGGTLWTIEPGQSFAAACPENVIVTVAGAVTEELFGFPTENRPLVSQQMDTPEHRDWLFPESDVRRAQEIAASISQRNDGPPREEIRSAEEEARKILSDRENVILTVASELDEKKCITPADVERLLPAR